MIKLAINILGVPLILCSFTSRFPLIVDLAMQILLFGALVALIRIAQAATTTLTTTTKSTAQVATTTSTAAVCTGTFSAISASDFVSNLHPGWNLGNTLDAVPDEGSWNNVPVVASTFDTAKAAGFKGVRLPVTWAYHFTGSSPDWTVDPTWLQRVSDVVDMIVARGLYAIVDVHHGMLYELVSKIGLS